MRNVLSHLRGMRILGLRLTRLRLMWVRKKRIDSLLWWLLLLRMIRVRLPLSWVLKWAAWVLSWWFEWILSYRLE